MHDLGSAGRIGAAMVCAVACAPSKTPRAVGDSQGQQADLWATDCKEDFVRAVSVLGPWG